MRARLLVVTLLAATAATPVAAQGTTPTGATPVALARAAACPANGVSAGLVSGDSTATPRLTTLRTRIDTTWHLDIAERRWHWQDLGAWLAAGLSGGGADSAAAGAPPAPARPFRICVGIGIAMHDATLLLRQVHGDVHFRADLDSLRRSLAGAPGAPPRR